MGILQDRFDKRWKTSYSLPKLKRAILRRALSRKDIAIENRQLTEVINKAWCNKIPNGKCSLQIPGLKANVTIDTTDLVAAIKDCVADANRSAHREIKQVVESLPEQLLPALKRRGGKVLGIQRKKMRNFEKRLLHRWRKGLDCLELLIMIARDAGASFLDAADENNSDNKHRITKNTGYLQEAMIGLHARACRTASEVLVLLKSGFADGANARWRSLHEITTTALFLIQHKGDTSERYLRHFAIEQAKAAVQYQSYCTRLGVNPLSIAEMRVIEREKEKAIKRFGKDFRHNYGWASKALSNAQPNFSDIEKSLRSDHWRPYYKVASHSVHAGSHGLYFSLGTMQYIDGIRVIMSGASNAGLADPGANTAIALMQITVAMLTIRPDLDSLVTCGVMREMTDEILSTFSAADEKLAKEHEELFDLRKRSEIERRGPRSTRWRYRERE